MRALMEALQVDDESLGSNIKEQKGERRFEQVSLIECKMPVDVTTYPDHLAGKSLGDSAGHVRRRTRCPPRLLDRHQVSLMEY